MLGRSHAQRLLPAIRPVACFDAWRGSALAAAHSRDLGAGMGPVSRSPVCGHLRCGHQPVHCGRRHCLLSGRAAELCTERYDVLAAAWRDYRLRGECSATVDFCRRLGCDAEAFPDSCRLAPADRRRRCNRAGLTGLRRRVPYVRHRPAGRVCASGHGVVAVGRTAGTVPAHRVPEPYEVVVRAAYAIGVRGVSGRWLGVLDRGAGRGDALDERRQ